MEDIVRESKRSPGAIYCYFRGKGEIVAAIADQRHNWETALLIKFKAAGATPKALQELAVDLFDMLRDPKEKQRRKVTIQFWSESLRNEEIGKIVNRGLRQRDVLTSALRISQKNGHINKDVDADSLSRVMMAILQGFILQQAWEPGLNIDRFLKSAMLLMNSAFTRPSGEPFRLGVPKRDKKRSNEQKQTSALSALASGLSIVW